MNSAGIDQVFLKVRRNKWLWYFSVLCRIVLVFAFISAGMVKILGERFAGGVSEVHPMGAYLEALYHTGFYYTFIGYAQVLAGVLLLIPRTVLLGSLIYLPIILNIAILSFAVRFDGSLFTAPLMILANLYLLFWNYDRLKFILPFKRTALQQTLERPKVVEKRFPFKTFSVLGFLGFCSIALVISINVFAIMPRNHIRDCLAQFEGEDDHGIEFCECIHSKGGSLDKCLDEYNLSIKGMKN